VRAGGGRPGVLLRLGGLAATTLGTGYSPVAPGTVGSLAGLAAYLLLFRASTQASLAAFAALAALSLPACAAGERLWGHDPGRVNIDEVVGVWIPCTAAGDSILLACAGFLLFRLFDILKPWPASRFNRMEGAAAVVLDDVAAGVMAALPVLAGRLLGVR